VCTTVNVLDHDNYPVYNVFATATVTNL